MKKIIYKFVAISLFSISSLAAIEANAADCDLTEGGFLAALVKCTADAADEINAETHVAEEAGNIIIEYVIPGFRPF